MAELRKSSANLDQISASPLLGASRRHKMGKVALWQPRASAGDSGSGQADLYALLGFLSDNSCQWSVICCQ
jgi:hypothetical protein